MLLLPDGHRVRVGASTSVKLTNLGTNKQFSLQLLQGQVWSLVKKASQPASFEVSTPSAVAGVTSTFFCVDADAETQETTVSTDEGSVVVRSVKEEATPPVPVTAGRMLRFGSHQRMPGQTVAHSREMHQMWNMIHQEGAWGQQGGVGHMSMMHKRETRIQQLLRARHPGIGMPTNRPGQPHKGGSRSDNRDDNKGGGNQKRVAN